jgi:hypothetical protein
MRQFSRTLLVFLLTLLLGLSPLQVAMASISDAFDLQRDTTPNADDFDGDTVVLGDYAKNQNCEMSDDYNSCINSSCPSGDCATCALTLPSITSYFTNPVTRTGMFQTSEDVVKQLVTTLFRPPKI